MDNEKKLHVLTCVLQKTVKNLQKALDSKDIFSEIDIIGEYLARVVNCAEVDGDENWVDWNNLEDEFCRI